LPLTFASDPEFCEQHNLDQGFYRPHNNIDIGLFLMDLEEVVKSAKQQGYELVSRFYMRKKSQGRVSRHYSSQTYSYVLKRYLHALGAHNSNRETVPREHIRDGRPVKNLRLIRATRTVIEPTEHLMSYINIYPHVLTGGNILSLEGGFTTQAEHHNGQTYTLPSERTIKLRGVAYMQALKEELFRLNPKKRKDPTQMQDYKLICAYLDKHPEQRQT